MFTKYLYGLVLCMLWMLAKTTLSESVYPRIQPSTYKTGSSPFGTLLRTRDLVISFTRSHSLPSPRPSLPPASPVLTHTTRRRIERKVEPNQAVGNSPTQQNQSNEYDYDKAYESFVEKYFNKKRTDALNEDDTSSSESRQVFDNTAEDQQWDDEEPQTAASTRHSQAKCKKEHRNGQECIICTNSRNNQKSESCSYSSETEPHSYKYTKQKSYRKQKDSSDESNEEDVEPQVKQEEVNSHESDRKITQKNKRNEKFSGIKRANLSKDRQDLSSCLKKVQKYKICYHCDSADGEQLIDCYPRPQNAGRDTEGMRGKRKKHVKKSKKKIIKRMVSYSYKKQFDFRQPQLKEEGSAVTAGSNLNT